LFIKLTYFVQQTNLVCYLEVMILHIKTQLLPTEAMPFTIGDG